MNDRVLLVEGEASGCACLGFLMLGFMLFLVTVGMFLAFLGK